MQKNKFGLNPEVHALILCIIFSQDTVSEKLINKKQYISWIDPRVLHGMTIEKVVTMQGMKDMTGYVSKCLEGVQKTEGSLEGLLTKLLSEVPRVRRYLESTQPFLYGKGCEKYAFLIQAEPKILREFKQRIKKECDSEITYWTVRPICKDGCLIYIHKGYKISVLVLVFFPIIVPVVTLVIAIVSLYLIFYGLWRSSLKACKIEQPSTKYKQKIDSLPMPLSIFCCLTLLLSPCIAIWSLFAFSRMAFKAHEIKRQWQYSDHYYADCLKLRYYAKFWISKLEEAQVDNDIYKDAKEYLLQIESILENDPTYRYNWSTKKAHRKSGDDTKTWSLNEFVANAATSVQMHEDFSTQLRSVIEAGHEELSVVTVHAVGEPIPNDFGVEMHIVLGKIIAVPLGALDLLSGKAGPLTELDTKIARCKEFSCNIGNHPCLSSANVSTQLNEIKNNWELQKRQNMNCQHRNFQHG